MESCSQNPEEIEEVKEEVVASDVKWTPGLAKGLAVGLAAGLALYFAIINILPWISANFSIIK